MKLFVLGRTSKVLQMALCCCALWLDTASAASDTAKLSQAVLSRTVLLGAAYSGNTIVAVSNQGDILLSSEDYRSWNYAKTPASGPLTSLSFSDRNNGIAVGHRATILRTSDGGASWKKADAGIDRSASLLDVLMLNAHSAIAVGAFGLYLHSADGGQSWHQSHIGTDDAHLNAITQDLQGHLVIVGENGLVYRSVDGGSSWQAAQSSVKASLLGVISTSANHYTAFGIAGTIITSVDGGLNWQRQDCANNSVLTGATLLRDGSLVIVSAAGSTLLLSADSHQCQTFSSDAGSSYSSVLSLGQNGILAFGVNGVRRLALPATVEKQHVN